MRIKNLQNPRKKKQNLINKKLPGSVIYYIIYQFIIVKMKSLQITKNTLNKYKRSVNYTVINDFLNIIHKVIAD